MLRRRFFAVARRLTRSAWRWTLHLPRRWPWSSQLAARPRAGYERFRSPPDAIRTPSVSEARASLPAVASRTLASTATLHRQAQTALLYVAEASCTWTHGRSCGCMLSPEPRPTHDAPWGQKLLRQLGREHGARHDERNLGHDRVIPQIRISAQPWDSGPRFYWRHAVEEVSEGH